VRALISIYSAYYQSIYSSQNEKLSTSKISQYIQLYVMKIALKYFQYNIHT